MHQNKYVFSHLVAFLDRTKFDCIVAKHEENRYIKYVTSWN
ncbi:DUF4372 domain-containing protein [Bacteroides bouchesdurhonensis]